MGSHGKINSVRGMQDILPKDMRCYKRVHDVAHQVAYTYGFRYMATPIVESSEVFKRSLGATSDVVHKEMYVFNSRKGEELVLRPENTASIVRAMISNGLQDSLPFRAFYSGPMFRYERPQMGRQRQFHQIGVELLGGGRDSFVDVEVIACGYEILRRLELDEKVKLHINNLGNSPDRKNYLEALKSHLNRYTSSLSEDSRKRLESNPLRILDSKDEGDRAIVEEAPLLINYIGEEEKVRFVEIESALKSLGIPYIVNPYLVRGLDYYCDTVFEFVTDELGAQGAVLAGGRYDGLVKALGGKDIDGIGWAAGIERLALMLFEHDIYPSSVSLIAIGEEAERRMFRLVYYLRKEDILCNYLYGNSVKKQMQYANRRRGSLAIILGDDELKDRVIKLKDLNSGDEERLLYPYEVPPNFKEEEKDEYANEKTDEDLRASLSKAFQAFYGESPE